MSSTQDDLGQQLTTALLAKFPSFIFIRDTSAASVAHSTLQRIVSEQASVYFAFVDCIACFTQRILFDSILYGVLDRLPDPDVSSKRAFLSEQKNENVDDFLHNTRALFANVDLSSAKGTPGDMLKIAVVLERAERLKETLPRLVHPLSRLQELVRFDRLFRRTN